MIRILTTQPMAVMPSAAPAVPVISGLGGRTWRGIQAGRYGSNDGTHRTAGFTAKRSPRLLGRPST